MRGLLVDTDGGRDPRAPAPAAAGDPGAFRELFEAYKGFVYALCLKILGRVEDAQDCSQEVWIRIQRALGGYEGRSSVRTWIGSIAANRARDMLRERDRFRRVLEAAMQIHRYEAALARAGEAEVHHGSLVEAVRGLDELERRIVELRLEDETLTLEELGERLGLPRHKVKYAWGKARDKLRQRLTEWSVAERLLWALLAHAAALDSILEVLHG